MLSKMYKVLFLFLLSNIQYTVSESKIDLYDVNIQQVEGTNHLEISFRVNGSIEDLNGHFRFTKIVQRGLVGAKRLESRVRGKKSPLNFSPSRLARATPELW